MSGIMREFDGKLLHSIMIALGDGTILGDADVAFPVGGFTRVVRPTITVDAAVDYADGDSVGGLITLSDFARIAAGSGILTRLQMRSKIDITAECRVHLFDANPSASTFTDNAAIVIDSADEAKFLDTITILPADWIDPEGKNPWYTAELIDPPNGRRLIEYQLAAGKDLYMAMEAGGAINMGSTSDIAALVAAENN